MHNERDAGEVDFAEAARIMFEASRDRFMRSEQCYPAIDALVEAGFIATRPPAPEDAGTVERVGLALLNSDRVRNGWPPVDSLSHLNDVDADTYRDSARAALAALSRLDGEG